jgi:hypothetical protein
MVYFVDAAWAQMDISMWHARGVAADVYREMFGEEMGITSGRRKATAVRSLHAEGKAMDIRTKHLTQEQEADLAVKLRERLGEDFDVVVEGDFAPDPKHRTKPRHIHVEHDPKGRHAEVFVE